MTKTTMETKLRALAQYVRFEIKIWLYAILHVSPIHWLDYRREVRTIERRVREELHKLLLMNRVIPLDDKGLQMVADKIVETLRQNLPDQ